ncbi:MAG: NTP transferase domain-containing protein [Woeseiaceae bacterium]
MSNKLFGLVLAGGQSRRMGQDKALLMRKGQSQLGYTTSLLEQVTDSVYVSARSEQQDDPERNRFPTIVDRYEGIGPVAGILSAMDEHPDADWLVLACDLPNIDEATLEYLLEHRAIDRPFSAFRSSYDGLPEPLCAVYASGSDSVIREFVADGIVCPRKMLINSDTELLEQPNPGALDNINTPEDLADSVLEAAQ